LGQFFDVWVWSGQPPLGLQNFPLKIMIFLLFIRWGQNKNSHLGGSENTRVKGGLVPYLQ